MKYILLSFLAGVVLLITISLHPETEKNEAPRQMVARSKTRSPKPEIPVLCYHRIRKSLPSDGKNMQIYSVSPSLFAQQMKALHNNGFHTILPQQLYDYLVHDKSLPEKPVLITFDDTREEQYRLGIPEMNKYGFKGVFFIMTVSINRPGYMTKTQIKDLSDNGNCIGAHSWDHHPVIKYQGKDWDVQLLNPKKQLESITGKPVNYFAYPSGIWDKAAISKLKSSGYQLAFILSTKSDSNEPLYTVRRLIVSGSSSTDEMLKAMQNTFNK
jgi:peptidoglycan/xylan/chitin deacetylase (PgdA/CDA1 family)